VFLPGRILPLPTLVPQTGPGIKLSVAVPQCAGSVRANLQEFAPTHVGGYFSFRVCAGEAGGHAGGSPAGRIGLFTTESWVREEAARPNPKARPRLNCPVATTVNLIE
jgi:hypothetical protein